MAALPGALFGGRCGPLSLICEELRDGQPCVPEHFAFAVAMFACSAATVPPGADGWLQEGRWAARRVEQMH